ncbi:TonB-dependent siderophore receptor [Pedobacter sp. UBA5917]|jgi:iron complex outermembrane receptor protein|uniref:TonB-dependent siderophore receptor n=1 Tax=Pedobacter sp. UBA5917 TaxID=1947061 RepID=UPI0025D47EFC|nr:TonB-dependent siderophore receptor [Pedobacter sp. UBA5917]
MTNRFILFALLAMPFGVVAQNGKTKNTDSAKTDSVKHLNTVDINSRYYRRYNIGKSSATLKQTTPLLQLPQNIQEIDKSILLDQQAININESVTRNVSGAIRNNTADFYGPFIFMRGAGVNTLRNGVDLSMIYYGPMPEDAAIIDRMEFIKGPAGFMNAIGDPAGSFNIVTKNPTGILHNNVSFTTGSFDLFRLSGDFDGNLDQNKKWQYRLNVVGQKAKSFQKFAFNDKFVIDPVLKYNINDHSSITAEYIYQKQQFLQYLLTVFTPDGFASLPRDFSISDPNKEPVKGSENNAFLTYENQVGKNWHLTAKGVFAGSSLDGNYFFVSSYNKAAPNLLPRRVTYERFNTDVYAFQAFVNGEVKTGSITHKLLGGIDANRKNLLAYSGYNDKTANPTLYYLDINNPVYGINFDSNKRDGALKDIATNKQSVEYYAAYAQDELNMLDNKLRITLAARLTGSKSAVSVPTVSEVKDWVVTPRAGISYSILSDFAAYAVYDNTYTPQSGLSTAGGVFKPLKGENFEFGLKKDWANGKWNTTLSFYRLTRDNIIVTDPSTLLQSQIGQTQAKGIEFDLKGEIVKGLNAVINYAYTDAIISKDANAALVGLPSPYLTKHIQNTWLNYRFPIGLPGSFTVSGGYQLQSGRSGRYSVENNLAVAPIFRLDGGLGWTNNHITVNAIVNNLLDRNNYGSAWVTPVSSNPVGLNAYVPFAPREFRLTVGYNF